MILKGTMNIDELLKEYNLEIHDDFQEDDGGADVVESKVICTNESGLKLLELETDLIDSLVSFETVCDLFPNCDNLDPYKVYALQWEEKLITE